ncbi:MAG TPA: protein kinase, partial [Pseudomonadota bacterium]|nr:protein kinase [Pseudomonadota bacterium]
MMQTPQAETTGFRFPTHFPPSTHPRGLPSALSFVDTQPDNIMLVRDPDFPGGERVKLLDFGIAKMAEHLSAQPVRTKSDVLMGTPTYMAPEQCRGAKLATDRSDVYSLGVILYQMLA